MNKDHDFYTKYIVTIIFVLLVSGCTKLGPDFMRPDVPIADEWHATKDIKEIKQSEDYSEWWAKFNDPVLDRLIAIAHSKNLPLQIAGLRILEARAQLGNAIGNQYPQTQEVNGSVNYHELSKHSPNLVPSANTSFNSSSLLFSSIWELDIWGKFSRGVESANASLLSEVANYDDVLVSLTADVANTYILIRTFEERLEIAKNNVEIQQKSLGLAEVRFRNGVETELDVQQAKTLLNNTQALIPSLDAGLQQSRNALSILLGMPRSDLREILDLPGLVPTAPEEIAIGIPAELLRRRPDVRRAELQAAAQSAKIGIAEAELYPQFSLLGFVGFQSSSTGSNSLISDLFSMNSLAATVGPSFKWNIFNYGRLKNNVRVQDAQFEQLIINYQNIVLTASREVEDALIGFLRAKEQVTYLGNSVDAARRSVDLALLQYKEGTTNYTRVLDTQTALVSQQDTHTAIRGEIAASLIAMYRALGGGWEIRNGQPYVSDEIKRKMKARTDWGELMTQ